MIESDCSKSVIFDLDGTLLYTLENLHESTNLALKHFCYKERSLMEIRSFVGNGVQKLIERAIPDGLENPNFESCLNLFKEHYSKTMYEKTSPYDGVISMLGDLQNRGIKCAVVSNKYDAAVKELCAKYFGDKITIAVGESSGVRKKPAPDSVFAVIKQLGCEGRCIYVGDSEVDLETAKNANIPCISVSWGYKDREFLVSHGAEKIADSVQELEKYIKEFFDKL